MTQTLKIENVDAELMHRAKMGAVLRQVTLRQFVIEALERSVPPAASGTRTGRKGAKHAS